MSINFIAPAKPYGDQWYPFYIGTFRDMIREYKEKEFHNQNMLNLCYINYNPWHAVIQLAKLGVFDRAAVDALRDSSEYECPLTNKQFHALMPVAIFGDNIEQYFPQEPKPWFYEMAVDKSWNVKNDHSHLNFDVTSTIWRCILGPGYTYGTLPDDGSPDTFPVVLDLSNGDKMVAIANAWYNK